MHGEYEKRNFLSIFIRRQDQRNVLKNEVKLYAQRGAFIFGNF